MNKRLLSLASMIDSSLGLIDVGTDHGYLPVHLASAGYSGKLIASDINFAPLSTAVNTAREAGYEDRISFLLSDGLDSCPKDEVDCIVIAGMGGDTICGILDRCPWCFDSSYQLLLQPVTKAEILRYWLAWNGFDILEEKTAEDGGIIYQILSARFGTGTRLNDAELFTGKYELASRCEHFLSQLDKLISRFEKAVRGLSLAQSDADSARAGLYSHILSQLRDMRTRYIEEKRRA